MCQYLPVTTELVKRSKSALVGVIESGKRAIEKDRRKTAQTTEKVYRALGGITALSTAAAVGVVEARVRNKDGTPLSLGPVPAHLMVGTALTITSFFANPFGQVSSAADGCLGAYGATMGRGWGNAWRAKAGGTKVSGDWEDSLEVAMEEEALLAGL